MKSSLLPVIVGLSLCSASAALLYVWLKTRDNVDDRKKTNGTKSNAKLTTIKLTLTNEQVPLVIGRGSRNLQAIEEESTTKITFQQKDENTYTCEIKGLYENVLKAEKLIRLDSKRSATITAEIFIPQAAYVAIVGRGGKLLREICRKSNAQVHIESGGSGQEKSDDKRRVMITGCRQSVDIAKSMIQEEIKEAIKEQETELKRDPRPSSRNQLTKSTDEIDGQSSAITPNEIKGFLKVYVSASASIDKFWVQLFGPQSRELDQLVNNMTKYYDIEENQELHSIADPYLGQIMTTRFKGDSKWYRAQVVGILPNEYNPRDVVLDVFFVDYGDSQYVNPNEVYSLHMDFLTLRFQAIECFLANVKPLYPTEDGSWQSAATDRFDELTFVARWKPLTAQVVTTRTKPTASTTNQGESSITGIRLYDNLGEQNVDVALELIENGFAVADNYNSIVPQSEDVSSNRASPDPRQLQEESKSKSVDAVQITNGTQQVPTQNGDHEGNNNDNVKLLDNLEKCANKSWNDMVEEDENEYASYSH